MVVSPRSGDSKWAGLISLEARQSVKRMKHPHSAVTACLWVRALLLFNLLDVLIGFMSLWLMTIYPCVHPKLFSPKLSQSPVNNIFFGPVFLCQKQKLA